VRPNLTNCPRVSHGSSMRLGGAHLFLLHELRVGAVVHDILAKDRCAERGVDLLGVDVLDLSVEDEVVAGGVEAHSHLAAEEDKGEDIAILLPVSHVQPAIASPTHLLLVGEEERIRVHAICDGTANHRQPVEHEGRLIGVLEQQLLQDIENDGQQDKGGEAGGDEDGKRRGGGEVAQGAGDIGEETHTVRQEATTEVKGVRERRC